MLPADIPGNPQNTYAKKGWKGFGDWLGTGVIATREMVYRPFGKARAFVHSLNLKSASEWRLICKGKMPELGTLPPDIPANPNQTYAKTGWVGMGDWLGTGTIAPRLRKFLSFNESRAFVQSLKLKSVAEWQQFCRGQLPEKGSLPADIPANPNRTYSTKGWKGYPDWLGKNKL
jgi:hypothetical protein